MIRPVLRKIKRLANKVFGTGVDELYWKFRHIFDREWAESYLSERSIAHPHRQMLVSIIARYSPFDSVLEIGCASGPNLYLLAKSFPKARLCGIDISQRAIEAGKKFFGEKGIKNVFLGSGKAERLDRFKDKSIDVIFTAATLIYLGPEKIESMIKEMLRVAKKSIILCEQHSKDRRFFYKDIWVHNYQSLFEKFVSKQSIKITKISPEIWQKEWGKLGYIIEVSL